MADWVTAIATAAAVIGSNLLAGTTALLTVT